MAKHVETYRGVKLWRDDTVTGRIVYGTAIKGVAIKRGGLGELKHAVDSYIDKYVAPFNVRIDIKDLIKAARVLGEFHVMAAGAMYATIETNEAQRKQLTRALVTWARD